MIYFDRKGQYFGITWIAFMDFIRNTFNRIVPNDDNEYELVSNDNHNANRQSQTRRSYRNPWNKLRRICTLCNLLIAIPVSLVLLVTAILLNGGVPPSYKDIRLYERNFPQHNRTYAKNAGVKYIAFPDHIWGHGWNNVLQEYLMLSYLAHITNRSFVFEDYTWSHLPLPYTLYDFALRPTRIPLNAYIAGPTSGGPIDVDMMENEAVSPPRAVNKEFWERMCPMRVRRVVSSLSSPKDLEGVELVNWWKETIDKEDSVCLQVDMSQRTIFNFEFFGSQQLLDVWPSLSKTAVLTQFKWSPLVLSAVTRNFVILPDIGENRVSMLRRSLESTGSRIQGRTISTISSSPSSSSPTSIQQRASIMTTSHTYPGLLALHIRRGDFSRHCTRLAGWNGTFLGFNSFDGLLDPWVPFNGTDKSAKEDYYRKRCLPTQEEIVERLHAVRADHDAFLKSRSPQSSSLTPSSSSLTPPHQLRRVFVLTNAWPLWLDGLKRQLKDDGWEDVIVSGDLVLDKEQQGVDVAVDMSIAEKSEVFVGNGFSSLSGNIVMLRTAQGLHAQTNRFL